MSIDKKFDKNELVLGKGPIYGIDRFEGEIPDDYRVRVAGELKERGQIIEAHEVLTGRLYDDPEQGPNGPMQGIFGAIIKKKQGIEYHPGDSESELENDDLVGMYAKIQNNSSPGSIESILKTFGPDVGIPSIETFSKDKK